MKWFNLRLAIPLSLLALTGSHLLQAAPNVNKPGGTPGTGGNNGQRNALMRTAATCNPAAAAIDLDINNVRARLMTGGDMWWDPGTAEARYEVPKGSRKNSLFAGSLWVGGYDAVSTLRVAAQTYRQDGNDYWPGPLSLDNNTITEDVCTQWDRFWKINRTDLNLFRANPNLGGAQYDAIREWPAVGNPFAKGVSGSLDVILGGAKNAGRNYAPFIDVNGNGTYEYKDGDYPDIKGDQYIWWVFNDAGSIKQQTQTTSIGLEVQASAFGFATKDFLNDATFYNYRLINRGTSALTQAYVATWTDADLGDAFDDYIGCDTAADLGILYNGDAFDGAGQPNSYGARLPMVGVDFFIGPQRKQIINGQEVIDTLGMEVFNWYNNDFSINGNPRNGIEIYNLMTAKNRVGQNLHFTYQGPGVPNTGFGTGPNTNFVFTGDPSNPSQWSECQSGNKPDDRRFVHSAGPFTLEAGGATNDITIGVVWVANAGGCPTTSFKKILAADKQAQDLFDQGFKFTEGPNAPRVVVRELDRKLVLYLVNDSISNNFQERYGRDTARKYLVSSAQSANSADPYYKFEGYRIFQLKNRSVGAAQIFDANGNVDNNVAVEIFQTDVANGITAINNFTVSDIADTLFTGQTKVTGKDSGIRHSFVVSQDAFATAEDKRLINYHTYYFVAVAYAYNNFRPFRADSADVTQPTPYLESRSGPRGEGDPIPVTTGMPNPAYTNMGNMLGSDYGSGVVIKRIEGMGNGGNDIQIDAASENALLQPTSNGIIANPTYVAGKSPVTVSVVDPVKVKPVDWELYVEGTEYVPASSIDRRRGIIPDSGRWRLVARDDQNVTETIVSERNIGVLNEQILEKYGIQVAITQTIRPGDDQANRNGYITSDVTFADQSQAWLAGISDVDGREAQNWIRSGGDATRTEDKTLYPGCDFTDTKDDTVGQFYETMLSNNGYTTGTWAPFVLGADKPGCPYFEYFVRPANLNPLLNNLMSVDVVFTSDRSKWTKCLVVETQNSTLLAQGGVEKFKVRKHASWNGAIDGAGNPIYATGGDEGFSYFPGYAINQETGERLNIIFGEDSWQRANNGNDMLWNPTSTTYDDAGNVLYGGKHYVYISSSRYDEGKSIYALFNSADVTERDFPWKGNPTNDDPAMMWMGLPTLAPGKSLRSLSDGLIPTETRLRFRVSRPYTRYVPDPSVPLKNAGQPYYTFSTRNEALRSLTDASNPYSTEKQKLLDMMMAVPNPYYGYAGYEQNRFDTRVRIINLPTRATINIYSADGTLVRRLSKDNTDPFIDWDIRNSKNLPIASGMYLMHVKAEGIGETVIRWFGSMRPIDATQY